MAYPRNPRSNRDPRKIIKRERPARPESPSVPMPAGTNQPLKIRFAIVDPTTIFGSVGRCGGGYNTVWEDWSEQGRAKRELIMKEFEEGMNRICGHYENLEKSMLEKGVLNPTIITCGLPLNRRMTHLPPEMRTKDPKEILIAEGITGGSRLWIAQKHKIPLPCIINDRTGRFSNCPLITDVNSALYYFTSAPMDLTVSPTKGIREHSKQIVRSEHLDEKWFNTDNLIKQRGPLWIDTMKKYGYNVHVSGPIRKMIYGK